MNIADKLIKGDIEPNADELKFLLWNTLIQLSAYCDDVISVEEESFNIEQMLSTLDTELGGASMKITEMLFFAVDIALFSAIIYVLFEVTL